MEGWLVGARGEDGLFSDPPFTKPGQETRMGCLGLSNKIEYKGTCATFLSSQRPDLLATQDKIKV